MIPLLLLQFLAQNTSNDFKILRDNLLDIKCLIRPQWRQNGDFVFCPQAWLFKWFCMWVFPRWPDLWGPVLHQRGPLSPQQFCLRSGPVSTSLLSGEGDVDCFCWNVTLKAEKFKYPVPVYSLICQSSYSAKYLYIPLKTLSLTFISFLFCFLLKLSLQEWFVNTIQTIWIM